MRKETLEWYQSKEFKSVLVESVRSSYHDTFLLWQKWEQETRELVRRLCVGHPDKNSKFKIWKKLDVEFGFAEAWEHRLSANLATYYPYIFTIGVDDNTDPDIVNINDPDAGIEFKTCTSSVSWDTKNSRYNKRNGNPSWSKKGLDHKKKWYPTTVCAWRYDPLVYGDNKIDVAEPKEIIFGDLHPDDLNFYSGRSASISRKVLLEEHRHESLFSTNSELALPRRFKK